MRKWKALLASWPADQIAPRGSERKASRLWREMTYPVVFSRDDWTCGLCGLPIDPTLPSLDQMAGVVDHIVPAVASGTDDMNNLQAAHRQCNTDKGFDSLAIYALRMHNVAHGEGTRLHARYAFSALGLHKAVDHG